MKYRLKYRQIPFYLIWMNTDSIIIPFYLFTCYKLFKDMVAEGLTQEFTVFCIFYCPVETSWKSAYIIFFPFFFRKMIHIHLHGFRELIAFLDSFQSGIQHAGKGEVGIAGGIWGAELYACCLLLARLVEGDSDEG